MLSTHVEDSSFALTMESQTCNNPINNNWALCNGDVDKKQTSLIPALYTSSGTFSRPASPATSELRLPADPHLMRAQDLPTSSNAPVLFLPHLVTTPSNVPSTKHCSAFLESDDFVHTNSKPHEFDSQRFILPPITGGSKLPPRHYSGATPNGQLTSLPALIEPKKWDCTRNRGVHQWDIKDAKLPQPTAFDSYELWPTGHCRRVYMQSCERARRHQSGWAMRNTNNHNPQVLKKSCLGVLECSLGCTIQGKPLSLRPAICDKARKKQTNRPCINPGCTGRLVLRTCRGHSGYPVTHFWRFANGAVYFEAKGEHDHNRPSLKTFGLSESYSAVDIQLPPIDGRLRSNVEKGAAEDKMSPLQEDLDVGVISNDMFDTKLYPNSVDTSMRIRWNDYPGQDKSDQINNFAKLDGQIVGSKCPLTSKTHHRRAKKGRRSKHLLEHSRKAEHSKYPDSQPVTLAPIEFPSSGMLAFENATGEMETNHWLQFTPQSYLQAHPVYSTQPEAMYNHLILPDEGCTTSESYIPGELEHMNTAEPGASPTQIPPSRWSSSTSSLSGLSVNTMATPCQASTTVSSTSSFYPPFDPSMLPIGPVSTEIGEEQRELFAISSSTLPDNGNCVQQSWTDNEQSWIASQHESNHQSWTVVPPTHSYEQRPGDPANVSSFNIDGGQVWSTQKLNGFDIVYQQPESMPDTVPTHSFTEHMMDTSQYIDWSNFHPSVSAATYSICQESAGWATGPYTDPNSVSVNYLNELNTTGVGRQECVLLNTTYPDPNSNQHGFTQLLECSKDQESIPISDVIEASGFVENPLSDEHQH